MSPQTREDHTYMLASPIRLADIFVPVTGGGTTTTVSIGGISNTVDGKWRTVMYFGRGIGGKYYTALDITTPGPFTRRALQTNVPGLVWSRGNPDTQNGCLGNNLPTVYCTAAGTVNNTASDRDKYAAMGQTWSVPVVGAVTTEDLPNRNTTRRTRIETVLYTGSGYGQTSAEGSTFFILDPIFGDVVLSQAILGKPGATIDNALVASPAGFSPSQLVTGQTTNPAAAPVQRVYFGDLHGRLWRWSADSSAAIADFGLTQPIGNAVGLLNLADSGSGDKRPYIYVETGNENRIPVPTSALSADPGPGFKLAGLRDEDLAGDPDTSDSVVGAARVLFQIMLPITPAPGYRGTVQPATALNGEGLGRVFFAATQFIQSTAASADPCVSHFQSLLYGVGAVSGGAAYGANPADPVISTELNNRINAVTLAKGQLVVDKGVNPAPPPPAPPQRVNANPPPSANVVVTKTQSSSAVCNDTPPGP